MHKKIIYICLNPLFSDQMQPRPTDENNNGNGKDQNPVSLRERCFCASLKKDGTTVKKESPTTSDIIELVGGSNISWVDYFIDDFEKDSLKAATSMGFSEQLVKALMSNPRSGYEDLEKVMGIFIPAILAKGFDIKLNPVLILIKENVILTLHTAEVKRFFRIRRYAETLMKKLPRKAPKNDLLTIILIRIIDENNNRNFEHLLEIEEQGDKLSEKLADPKTPRATIGGQIHEMKHALVIYLGGQWAVVDVLNSLRYGDADLLTDDPKIQEKITALVTEVNSHIGLAEHLSEVLASGLEVVQSIYNNQLQTFNNRLALLVGYLTIIGTALLVPNTIATVLGSPAFNLTPNDAGWYLILLAFSTIGSTIGAWYIVKKMNLLPEHPE